MPRYAARSENVGNEKLAAAILYILRGCSPSRPGLTGLLKMVWYADYWHYRQHLSPVTDAKYAAIPDGPVVDDYDDVFDHLVDEEYLDRKEVPIQRKEHPKQEYRPLIEPDEDIFSETEKATLDRVIEELGHLSGSELSEMTHKEPPWGYVWHPENPGVEIPYGMFRWLQTMPDEDDLDMARNMIEGTPELRERIRELNES